MRFFENTLKVKLLKHNATLPSCAHREEDLGYDLYSAEHKLLLPGRTNKVHTEIAVELPVGYGALIKDRSSMASKGVWVSGGVLDNGYRGEVCVLMNCHEAVEILVGQKIAQLVPIKTLGYWTVQEEEQLSDSERSTNGFGSTGA